jgi:threonine synthase
MICVSTRGQAPAISFKEAVLAGLAPDGGLYVPQKLDARPDEFWAGLRGKSFQDVSVALAASLVGDEFGAAELDTLIRDALSFPIRMERLDVGLQAVELFHGPTFAFKDFGARTLARLLALSEQGATVGGASPVEGMPLTVLVATSGDTGSAVAQAFFSVPGTRVVVLYPEGRVSAVQEAQFTTLGGNVTAVAVNGTFDDCQRLAKEAFADRDVIARLRLTSANSISLGRLIPQIFYYAYAALQLPKTSRAIFSVPCGNFGNLVAGVMAWRLGAPIEGFVAATTINDTVPRYFASGVFEPRPSIATLANAMDVGNPSNVERLQWLFGGDVRAMKERIEPSVHTDEQVRAAILEIFDRFTYVTDPHTAIAFLGTTAPGTRHEARGTSALPYLFLATAHPAKFKDVVEPIIGQDVELPPALAESLARPKIARSLPTPSLAGLAKLL